MLRSSCTLIVVFAAQFLGTTAYPFGAGWCPAGIPAVGGSHIYGNDETNDAGDALSKFGLEVRIDGVALRTDAVYNITVRDEHSVELVATGNPFRGFLLRLGSAGGIDTVDAILPDPSDTTNVQVSYDECVDSEEVGGITHTNPLTKTSAKGILRVPQVTSSDLPLDVTVVVRNIDERSQYYYSRYLIAVTSVDVVDTEPPTPAAAVVVTSAPSTLVPSPAPSPAPSVEVPTPAPVVKSAFTPTPFQVPTTADPTLAPTRSGTVTDAPSPAPLASGGETDVPSPSPVDPTPAPADPTPAPAEPTPTPVDPTPAPVDPTPAPVDPTPGPAAINVTDVPSLAPVNGTPAPSPTSLANTETPVLVVPAASPVVNETMNETNGRQGTTSRFVEGVPSSAANTGEIIFVVLGTLVTLLFVV